MQYLGGSGKYEEKLDEDGIPINPPIDYEFETGMNDTKLKKQNILMPPIKSRLFVTKHIGNYEPMTVSSAKTDKFTRTAL